MADMIVVEGGEPDDGAQEPRRDTRTWVDVMHPEQQRNGASCRASSPIPSAWSGRPAAPS